MSTLYESLTQWIEMQKKVKEWFSSVNENAKKGDRLELILYTRMAFQHMIRTLKAFDSWLQDPFIISNITVYNILLQLIDLDVKHTSEFRDYISKLEKEGKLSPILLELFGESSGRRRRGEREGVSLSI
jgi:hypothetical protein